MESCTHITEINSSTGWCRAVTASGIPPSLPASTWTPGFQHTPSPNGNFGSFSPILRWAATSQQVTQRKVSSRRESGQQFSQETTFWFKHFTQNAGKWDEDAKMSIGFPLCLQSSKGFCRILVQQLPWGRKWSIWGIWHCLEKPYFYFPPPSQLVLLWTIHAKDQFHSFVPGNQSLSITKHLPKLPKNSSNGREFLNREQFTPRHPSVLA